MLAAATFSDHGPTGYGRGFRVSGCGLGDVTAGYGITNRCKHKY